MDTTSEEFKAFYAKQLAVNVSLPEKILKDYSVSACLTSSDRVEVYLLESKAGNRKFVLKQRPKELAQISEAEYALLKSLHHEGIPKAVDYFVLDETSYFIREYFEGTTLDQLVKIQGALSVREITRITLQLCGILDYLHMQSPPIIHRDVKPQNVIITQDGDVKLIDFDISRKFNPDAVQDTVFMGTSTTAPPEQYGYTQTDVRSDIYSLGVLIIFAGSGRYNIAAVDALPAKLAKIARKCTQFAPKDRFASVSQVRRRLRTLRHDILAKLGIAGAFVCCSALSFYLGSQHPVQAAALPVVTTTATPHQSAPAQTPASATAVSSEGVVNFASYQIEQNVRKQLGKAENEPIMLAELNAISEISVKGDSADTNFNGFYMRDNKIYVNGALAGKGEIETLTDIPLFKNLTKLELPNQRIEDISPLKGMRLSELILDANDIQDLSALADMKTLTWLNVDNNPIEDISPLASLIRLKTIGLKQTSVTDITPLANIKTLKVVGLFDMPCADFSPLVGLPRLEIVDMSDSSAADVAVVVQNKNIRDIKAHRCGITDIQMFAGLPNLERLELWQDDVTDLKGIEAIESLAYLNLNYTPVTDLQPLAGLKRLKELELAEVKADLTPLLDIVSLERIHCTADMQAQIDKIKDKARFVIEIGAP